MLVLLVLGVLVERVRGTDPRDHVLALRVGQPLAVELVVAGRRVAGEGHAGRRVITHVAKDHGLDVDRGAPVVGDALDAAIGNGALAVPRREDSTNSAPQLLARVVREVLAQNLLDLGLEARGQIFKVLGRDVGVRRIATRFLNLIEHAVELLPDPLALLGLNAGRLFHHHVGVHHNEAAVGVVDETRVAGFGDEARDRGRAQTAVEDRLHHPGHRGARARADRYQQWVGGIAKLRSMISSTLAIAASASASRVAG